jgi:hypothetical chaperone protein
MADDTLAIDFGTSNTAAACLDGGRPRRLSIEPGSDTLPTAVFFPAEGGAMQIGQAATDALISGDEGRYMRALKSVLGTSLFHEPRPIGGKRQTLADIVTAFLVQLKSRAEAQAVRAFRHVLSGRPVHFHSADSERDARAAADLHACYLAAGFASVDFLPEPEAAALASHGLGRAGDIGLIVDIGGGTSDFSLFRSGPDGLRILASHGIRLGGTDFDHAVSMTHAMPLLGHGGEMRRTFGHGLLPVPNAIFAELATWAKIPFLYTAETRRHVADLVRNAVAPRNLQRLATVIEQQSGHALAFAVEAGKIAANGNAGPAQIDMGFIEPRLSAPIDAQSLNTALDSFAARLRQAMQDTLDMAGVPPDAVGSAIMVGGSSLMAMIRTAAIQACPKATLHQSEAFTAVVDGLALATASGRQAF